MKALVFALCLSLVACTTTPVKPDQPAAADPREQARADMKLLLSGDADAFYARCTTDLRKVLGNNSASVKAMSDAIAKDFGVETKVIDEVMKPEEGMTIYVRRARFSKQSIEIDLVEALDAHNQIALFKNVPVMNMPAPTTWADYQLHAELHLPVKGQWTVIWGGQTIKQNYHAASYSQRFAYDMVVGKDGKSHSGEGKENTDYYCFGQPVTAPAAGTVVEVVDGIDDNVPGKANTVQVMGNHVIIDMGNNEFVYLAHFQKGSLVVKPGQMVHLGDALGLAGNSGHSSQPHLHLHIENSADVINGEGLPAPFSSVLIDGVETARGTPVKGQTVEAR